MLLFCAKMIVKELHNFELDRLNKKKKKENILAVWWLSGLVLLQCFFMALEDEQSIVIKAYKLNYCSWDFERFFVLS